MRKIPIITLVSAFFIFTLVVINIALFLEYKRQNSDLQYFAFQRFTMAMKVMRDMPYDKVEELAKLGIIISQIEKRTVKEEGKVIFGDPFSDVILYANKLYFVPRLPPPPPPNGLHVMPPPHFREPPPMLEDKGEFSANRVWILGAVVNTLLLLFFGIVLRKLLRLKNLKSAIQDFSEQSEFKVITVDSEDEIGEIAIEFNCAMQKIHRLKEARALFLRNILHELKTPIMKGQILSSSLENPTKKELLERIFTRLESLLGEMVKVEKLTSNEWILQKKEYRLVDVLDHAMDLLMSDTQRIHVRRKALAPIVLVDFELFATALKNLLDNALKYSTQEVEVNIFDERIEVSSKGEALPKERLDFGRAFNRAIESSTNSLGLGLYIANAIIVKHQFKLSYIHQKGENFFIISFS